jgi:hypothetical protein
MCNQKPSLYSFNNIVRGNPATSNRCILKCEDSKKSFYQAYYISTTLHSIAKNNGKSRKYCQN